MKNAIPFLFLLFISLNIGAQDLDVAGKVRISTMDSEISADSVVVRLADGTLALSSISTLSEIELLKNRLFKIEFALGKDSISDITGNYYKIAQYGSQFWFKENLRTTQYNDGSPIDSANSALSWITNPTNGKWSWYNGDSTTFEVPHGKMYNWYAVDSLSNGGRNICPSGWHVATLTDITSLGDHLTDNGFGFEGSGNDVAKSMASISGWDINGESGNVGNDQASNNTSGFNGHPGGLRAGNGGFGGSGSQVFWWTSTSFDNEFANNYGLTNIQAIINAALNPNELGHYVRCVKD